MRAREQRYAPLNERRRHRYAAWFGCCTCMTTVIIALVLVLTLVVAHIDDVDMIVNTTTTTSTTTTFAPTTTTATTTSSTTPTSTTTMSSTTTTSTTVATTPTSTTTTTPTSTTTMSSTTATTTTGTTTAAPTSPASFSLVCPPQFVGELELNVVDVVPALTGTPTVIGTGCGGNTVFNTFYTDSFFGYPSFISSKRDDAGEQSSFAPLTNTTNSINCTTMDLHVMPVPMDAAEYNMTILNETTKRDFTFPSAAGSSDASAGILYATDAITGVAPDVPLSVSIAVNHNLTAQVQQLLFGTGFSTAAYMSGTPIGTYFANSFFSSGPCSMGTSTQEIIIKYDFEVERWLLAFVAPDSSTVCVALSDSFDANAPWSGYSFTNPTPIGNFEFAIWGDYYTWCADSFFGNAQCYIIERAEIIGGTGMPRMCQMQSFQSVTVDNGVGIATPLDQMHNNRSGLAFTSYPCGVFYVPLSNLNRIAQLGCTSIDFATCTISGTETFTTYTAWSTASGSCPSFNDCVPTNTGTLNPLRDRMSVAYHHDDVYPNHLAWAFSYDSNGVDNAKVRWQEGTFSLSGPPIGFQTINDGSGTQQWHPRVAIDEFHTLLIAYYYADESSDFPLINYKYRLRTSPPNQLSNRRAITPTLFPPITVFDSRIEDMITVMALKRQPGETVVTRTRPFYVTQLSEPSDVSDDYFQLIRMVRIMIQRVDRQWNYQDSVCLSNVTCTQELYLK